ncbi:MAG TPA: AAA family ATPase [Acidimicrobiales bacterium]|nr:AAA family ATPase [Acidimicrobiales bacterium]
MSDWPLVGRVAELALVRDLLASPETRGVVLAGPAGVGKTRLGQECLRIAERAGLDAVQVTATRSAAQLPFGAVAPVLHEVAPQPGAVDDRIDVLRRSVAALGEGSDGRRLVLFVDDAHLLDDASATLVHQVAATGSAIVLATVCTGEPAPDSVVALWKDGLAARVEVAGLSPEAVGELLATALDGPVDPATVVQFTDRCQGNAVILRELVMGALDDGSLEDDRGMWRLTGQLSPSARLLEIVEARLGQLDDRERALMELVAYGEPLGLAELAVLSDPALAEGLERRDLLTSQLDGRRLQVRLAHPIYGDVVRARTPALRARAIAQSLAEAVEATDGQRHDDSLQVATWRLLAGGGDPDTLLEGATIARWRYDFPLAERLARAAVDAGGGFDAALLAAHVTGLHGRREEAEAALAALAVAAADDAQRGQVAVARFDNHGAWTGGADPLVLDDAARTIADPGWRDRLQARRLTVLLATEGPRAAAEAAQALASRADGEALTYACLVGAYSLARLGRLDAAVEMSERGRTARQALDTPLAWPPWWHTVTSCVALRGAGRFAEAERIVSAHHGEALDEGSVEAQAVFALLEADGIDDRGRVRSAACRGREALAAAQRLGSLVLGRHARTAVALALALSGEAGEAADELRALDDPGRPRGVLDEVDLLRARGWAAAAAGDLPRARQHLERAAALSDRIGDLLGEVTALHGLARIGRAREVCDRLSRVAARIDGDLAPARAAHAHALAGGDAVALDQASHDFEALGADLLAAEAAADAAVAHRRAGEVREATAAERRAGTFAERCEDPVTPALQAVDVRARLTPAERETAVLAAGGRTNKEIARLLYLSSRTIENRLQRVYGKLGISGRTELAQALSAGG